MANLTINTGVNSLGNYGNTDIPLAGVSTNILSIKTLVNGKWKSWTKATPEIFQGINSISKGSGFVANSSGIAELNISDEDLDINTITINTGLNYIAIPFNKRIVDGLLPRFKASSLKTLDNNWKSWTEGAPDSFQGFANVDKTKGYICNINMVYGNYLSNVNRDIETGVRIGTAYTNSLENISTGTIVEFTPDMIFKSIDYVTKPINNTLPLKEMWVKIKDVVKLIKFPVELKGDRFSIKESVIESIDNGSITTAVDLSNDYGSITDSVITITTDLGDLLGSYKISSIVYSGVFNDTDGLLETNPIELTDIINLGSMEIMFDIETLTTTVNYNKMYIKVGTENAVIEFANEYIGKPFVIIKNDKVYNGVFTVSNSYITL